MKRETLINFFVIFLLIVAAIGYFCDSLYWLVYSFGALIVFLLICILNDINYAKIDPDDINSFRSLVEDIKAELEEIKSEIGTLN